MMFIVVAQWNDSPWIDISLHSDTASCIQANQSFPILLYAVWLAQKQHIPILKFLTWPDRGSNTRPTTLEAWECDTAIKAMFLYCV
jgi:hypothetical protein